MRTVGMIFLCLGFSALLVIYKYFPNTPMITFPKGAQHNTIGELPIVEVMDDGDFYEKDGAEEETYSTCIEKGYSKLSPYTPTEIYRTVEDECRYRFRAQLKKNCVEKLIGLCTEYKKTKNNLKKCAKDIQDACEKTKGSFAKCEDLGNIFGGGAIWTCSVGFE